MYNKIELIGALTLKPFVFNYRAWELEKGSSIDFFDSFANDIYVEFFGLNIYRITPKVNSNFNNEWCTDRIRFFFDALNIQKLVYCFIRKNNFYKVYNWYGVYKYFQSLKIFNFKIPFIKFNLIIFTVNYFLTLNFNLYFLIFLKSFFYKFYNYNLITSNLVSNKFLNIDILNNFFFNYLDINNIYIYYKDIYIIGYNLRCEHPLFFFKLYSYVRKKQIKLYIFGNFFFYNIKLYTIGLSWFDFIKNFFNFKLLKNNLLIIIGSGLINRNDFLYLHFFFTKIKEFSLLYNFNIKIMYIYYTLIDINLIYIGLYTDFRLNSINTNLKNKLLVIYDYLNYSVLNKFNFNFFFLENEYNIYIYNTYKLSLIVLLTSNLLIKFNTQYHLLLPQLFIYEEDNLMVDIFYKFKYSFFIYAPKTKNIKSSIDLINNIYKLYKFSFKNIFITKYFFFFNKKYFYIKNIKINYLKFYNLLNYNLIVNNYNIYLINFYKNILYIKLYNNYILYTINNFFFLNLYSKLSQNLLLNNILYKKYKYLLK
jgi:hypothetical protein